MLNLHVKIAKFGWGGMPPDPATTVWFVTFFNPYEFAGMHTTTHHYTPQCYGWCFL